MTQKEINSFKYNSKLSKSEIVEILKPWFYLLVVGTATAAYTLKLLTEWAKT